MDSASTTPAPMRTGKVNIANCLYLSFSEGFQTLRNVTAAFMGRLDFEASYNAVTSTLRKGEKEWRAFWVDMFSYSCTNIHREALEKRIWKLLDVFDDLLVALDRYWFPVSCPSFILVVTNITFKQFTGSHRRGPLQHVGRPKSRRRRTPLRPRQQPMGCGSRSTTSETSLRHPVGPPFSRPAHITFLFLLFKQLYFQLLEFYSSFFLLANLVPFWCSTSLCHVLVEL